MKMDGLELMFNFLEKARKDARIGPVHISLFTAMIKCWSEDGYPLSVNIISRDLMNVAKICSPTTYHRIIRQLDEFGYIIYVRTNSKWECSQVILEKV